MQVITKNTLKTLQTRAFKLTISNMSELYPLKFEPLLKEKVWGGNALEKHFNKKPAGSPKYW